MSRAARGTAQYHMAVADYAAVLGTVKPAFIHHPDCKRLIHSSCRSSAPTSRDYPISSPSATTTTRRSCTPTH